MHAARNLTLEDFYTLNRARLAVPPPSGDAEPVTERDDEDEEDADDEDADGDEQGDPTIPMRRPRQSVG